MLQIVTTDFVPIQPYYNTSVQVGIGQRYNVIVEANSLTYDDTSPLPTDGNYWIRTKVSGCSGSPGSDQYEETGILRYNDTSTADPSSDGWANISTNCADENYASLHPIVPWYVGPPSNTASNDEEQFDVWSGEPSSTDFPLAEWTLGNDSSFAPLRINYSNPTFLNLDNTGNWYSSLRIIAENHTSADWVNDHSEAMNWWSSIRLTLGSRST